ncbi:MAG: glucose-6-phosphate isomerase [Kiritimatiellae bacterium]|nr:glucose-6-phosphate isomerase [Kiritimatiellia bacterium]
MNPGFDIHPTRNPMGFRYGPGVFGPECELRRLDAIRASLLDPECEGPDPVYAIAMDVGTEDRRKDLLQRNLLFGVVTYAAGQLGDEPVRSQGHIHAVSASCGCSTPELYEIWSGTAIILMQEYAEDDPGRCFAVTAEPGETVVVPPNWAHATISADPTRPLTFGAWCVRDFGFDYCGVRAHGGMAWFACLVDTGLVWNPNPRYPVLRELICKRPSEYADLGLRSGIPIWQQYLEDPDSVMWVPDPQRAADSWPDFVP